MVGGRTRRARRWAPAAAMVVLLAACSADDADPTDAEGTTTGLGTATTPSDGTAITSTTSEMRPVPTVPPSTLAGQVTVDDGVVDASPTIAPVPVDPNAPTTSFVAPTTELVGDPQPNPEQTSPPPPPPPTTPDDPDACARLAPFDIVTVIADTVGISTTAAPIGDEACRYTGGSLVVEVHFVSIAEIRDDWSRRAGIEPVGEVSSDAVGFSSFIPPGSPSGAGYTIAVEGGSIGVVVAVTGTGDARRLAGQVAIFAGQAE